MKEIFFIKKNVFIVFMLHWTCLRFLKKGKNYMNNKLVKNFIHDNWKLLINEKNMNYVGQKKKKKNLYMKLECHKFTFLSQIYLLYFYFMEIGFYSSKGKDFKNIVCSLVDIILWFWKNNLSLLLIRITGRKTSD